MYAQIKDKRSIRKLYTESLVNRGDLTLNEAEDALTQYKTMMDTAFEETRESAPPDINIPEKITLVKPEKSLSTGISADTVEKIISALTTFPDDFTVHPKLIKQIMLRRDMLEKDAIDWSLAEALAFGSLLLEKIPIRLAGQDSRRGTFSQRHSVLVDYNTSDEHMPLSHIEEGQERAMIHDSLLSEYAALGFEYGYAVIRKNALVLWEAQFGDFINGAQIIIDQFISSAEDKWGQTARLTILLPHGFEGQGPEHSSSRVERFLTLCAEENIRVTVPTTSGQYFHLLRNQAKRKKEKPLVILTPKSLLRADVAKSSQDEILKGSFQVLLPDTDPPKDVKRIIFCTGKIYHELSERRKKKKVTNELILRLEQLYPFPFDQVTEIFTQYKDVKDIRWVQEEPRNMGAWNFALERFQKILPKGKQINFIGRLPSASPAAGSYQMHLAEHELLIRQAFE
jgi:2-oxoglutarate dehydrogenase complex dehydrogenase (E1) component-like enzyme